MESFQKEKQRDRVTRTFLRMAAIQPALQLLSVLLELLHLDLELLAPPPPLLLLLLQLLNHGWRRDCKCQGQEMKMAPRKHEANWVQPQWVGHWKLFQMFCVEMEASQGDHVNTSDTNSLLSREETT